MKITRLSFDCSPTEELSSAEINIGIELYSFKSVEFTIKHGSTRLNKNDQDEFISELLAIIMGNELTSKYSLNIIYKILEEKSKQNKDDFKDFIDSLKLLTEKFGFKTQT